MAGPIKFTINYTCSPDAISGVLEYRRLQPDNTWTNWVPALLAGNPFTINTNGGTTLNQTLSNIFGNGTDFMYNTTYDFRIKQNCTGGISKYSNISNPIYELACPDVDFLIDLNYTQNSGYALIVRVYNNLGMGFPINPNTASIVSYSFDIRTDVGGSIISIGSFTLPVTSLTVGAPYYDFIITSDDLTQPIQSLATYYLNVGFSMQTGPIYPTFHQPCSVPLTVTTPPCSTYRIYANEFAVFEWRDCSGTRYTCGFSALNFGDSSFYICSQTQPIGYSCVNGPVNTTSHNYQFTVLPNKLFEPGITPFEYLSSGNPDIAYGALVELTTINSCDANFNGDLNLITSNQLSAPWYNNYPAALDCVPPPCLLP